MDNGYTGVRTRFLSQNERFMGSDEQEMPLVIEPNGAKDLPFLQQFLKTHSAQIKQDIARYGAVLLRGFDVHTDHDYEQTVLSIDGFNGISEAFMSEEGRIHIDNLKYVLHTNAVYKTGGTVYLGGFHSENYYSPDVPSYICFHCQKPSLLGGETGLINMEKIYQELNEELKQKLAQQNFFVSKWLVSEVAERYQLPIDTIHKLCKHFDLPLIGEGSDQFILMYKPNIFEHPVTGKKSLQINLFEVIGLNEEMRRCFVDDYQGKEWFWHRVVWRLPTWVLKVLEYAYMSCASFFYSPKNSLNILKNKIKTLWAGKKKQAVPEFNDQRVGSVFNQKDVKQLAQLIRKYYSSCLWQKGDVMLIDNKKVMHAGMPGSGPRTIRALIANPLEMQYSHSKESTIACKERSGNTIGYYMSLNRNELAELDDKLLHTR